MRFRSLIGLCLLLGACSSCKRHADKKDGPEGEAQRGEPASVEVREAPAERTVDLIDGLPACEVHHRGLSIDFGTRAADYVRAYSTGPFDDVVNVDREGATFGRVRTRVLRYEFWLDEAQEGVALSLRVHGGIARIVSAEIDDKRLGAVRLTSGETRIVAFPAVGGQLGAGRHRLVLRFAGKLRGADDEFAELDWLRIAVPDELPGTYSAPTLRDIVTENVALGNKPKRSLVLRAPGSVRCAMRVARDAEVRLALGYWGAGHGRAQIRVLSDAEAPITLVERAVEGGPNAAWLPIRADLTAYANRLIALEFRVLESTRGGRVAFGDPVLAHKEEAKGVAPRARTAVIVIESGLDRRQIPPWGPTGPLSALGELARVGVAFSGCRAQSTVPGAAVASLLTGMSPRLHGLEDQAARLPEVVHTLGELVKEASGRTAMFTGVPTTFPAFGFSSGWDRYETYSPVKDVPAHQPLLDAARWLESELGGQDPGLRLLVVHARGAHPPWDLTREEMGKLKPDDYGGPLDPRRGAITLGNIRARKQRAQRRLADEDWVRLRELMLASLVKQDQGLARLIATLKRASAWDDALFVVVGDVATGDPPEVPFEPAGPLSEDRLLVPMIVKFPGAQLAGREVGTAVTDMDVARTVLELAKLKVPERVSGENLFEIASGREPLLGRAMIATLGNHYASRAGMWLLTGETAKTPRLCQLDVDPACVNDVFDKRPIAARALWQWTFDAEVPGDGVSARRHEREPASIDGETAAALTVWGDL